MSSEFTKEEVKQEIARRRAFDKRVGKVFKRYLKLTEFGPTKAKVFLKDLNLSELYIRYEDSDNCGYHQGEDWLEAKVLWETDKVLAKLKKEQEKDHKECEELRKARQVQDFVDFLEAYPTDAKKILKNRDLGE